MTLAAETTVVRFSAAEMELFRAASHDSNPIHHSPRYARKTPFGEPVVFGALGAISCLAGTRIATGQVISELKVDFAKPLYCDIPYRRSVEQSAGKCKMSLSDGGEVVLKLTTGFSEPKAVAGAKTGPHSPTSIRRDVSCEPVVEGMRRSGAYEPDLAAAKELFARFGVDPEAIGWGALFSLLWSSYAVGMEVPGERSMFMRLSAAMSFSCSSAMPVDWSIVVTSRNALDVVDTDFTLAQGGQTFAQGTMRSMIRPNSTSRSERQPRRGSALAGKVALVVGGSRGLGAAIVQELVAEGCTTLLNYHMSDSDAKQAQADVPDLIELLPGDAADLGWWAAAKERIVEIYGHIDFLVCSAAPPLRSYRLEPATIGRINDFVAAGLKLVDVPIAALSDILAPGATVVVISSTALNELVKEWPHYAAMKAAVEALVQVVARQQPQIAWLIARPPKLATDMVNTAMGSMGATDPAIVAAGIVARLTKQEAPGRVEVLEFENHWKAEVVRAR